MGLGIQVVGVVGLRAKAKGSRFRDLGWKSGLRAHEYREVSLQDAKPRF